MLNKNFFLGCFIAALTACGGDSVDLGPNNPNFGEDPPPPEPTPVVEKNYVWDFAGENAEAQVDDWRTGADLAPTDANEGNDCNLETEISLHYQHPALQVKPTAGGWTEDFQDMCAMGFLSEPRAMNGGRIELSMYIPSFFTDQNPWNTDADNDGTGPEDDRFNFGLQILLEDESGNRAEAAGWINVYDLLGAEFNPEGYGYQQREPDPASGQVNGRWFDMSFNGANYAGADAGFDIGAVVGVGFRLTIRDTNVDLAWQENEQYVFVTNVVMEPDPNYIPPPTAIEPSMYATPVYLTAFEEGYSLGEGANGVYGVEEGYLQADYDAESGYILIAGPEPAPEVSSFLTFHMSAYGALGSGTTSLSVSLCDCEDDVVIEVVEGEWTSYEWPVSTFNATTVGAIRVALNQAEGGRIFFGNIGFDKITAPAADFSFALPVYMDSVQSGFTDTWGGWGGTWNWSSVAEVQNGTSAIEAVFDANGYGALQIGGPSPALDVTGYTNFHFSAYAAEGSGDVNLRVSLCDCEGATDAYVTVVEGEWTDFTIPVADFDDISMGAIRLRAWQDPGATVYFDNIGFDKKPTPAFTVPVYRNGVESGFTDTWGGWGGVWDWESTAVVQTGDASIEAVFDANGYGALQIGGPSPALDVSGYINFHFSAYAAEGSGDVNLRVSLCDCEGATDAYVTVVEGEWTDFTIPVTDFDDISMAAIRLRIWQDPGATIYFDNIGFDAIELPELTLPVYRDGVESGFVDTWGGWGGTWDWASESNVLRGASAIELIFDENGYGSLQIGGASPVPDLSSYTTFNFAAYGALGSGTTTLRVSLCDCESEGDAYVDVIEGQWTHFSLPLADFTDTSLGAIRIRVWQDPGSTIYVDEIGFN